MAFSSISDARTKLRNPETAEDSQILYANNNLLDSTTIFYTNTAKTILASAGNYVIPTQYKTYYVTLGSDGKISGTKTELIEASADSSWVDDTIVYYPTGEFIPNDYFDSGAVGTSLSITSGGLLTDSYWSSRSYAHSKKWVIDGGTLFSTAITNIDVSAMAGYDLRLITGEYYQNNWPSGASEGFVVGNTTSAIIHVKQDLNRQLVNGRVNYYFRPDYYFPLSGYEYTSFFKRLPDCLPIYDKNGVIKDWMSLHLPLFDMVEKGSGVLNVSKRTIRTSTRHNKGYTFKQAGFFFDTNYGSPSNSNYYMKREADGGASSNIIEFINYANKHIIHYDGCMITPGEATYFNKYGVYFGSHYGTKITDQQQSWIVGLWESLLITNTSDRNTWTFSNQYLTNIPYWDLNPWGWTTALNSGSARNDISPANQLLQFFNPISGDLNPQNLSHAKHVQFDFEAVAPAVTSKNFGIAYNQIWNNCKTYSIAINWEASGGVIPNFSNYEGGIYKRTYEGANSNGWRYVQPGVSIATVKNTPLYKDYKEYYYDGSKTRTASDFNYHSMYEGAIEMYSHFFCTAYLHNVVEKWYLYNLVHSYDISKKLLVDILGATLAQSKRVCAYSWRYTEPIDGSDIYYERKGVLPTGERKGYRVNNPPSHNQSLAVWAFAYMDGLYIWDNGLVGGEYNKYNEEYSTLWYAYGELFTIDNGMYDWFHIGYWQVMQNKDIVAANTPWLKTELKIDSTTWTSNTDSNTTNLPVMLYNQQRPISAYKVSTDGTEALLIMTSPFNNGYTKETFTVRLPSKSNQQFDIDVWGNFTTVVRLKNI